MRYAGAASLLDQLVASDEFVEFLTAPAYETHRRGAAEAGRRGLDERSASIRKRPREAPLSFLLPSSSSEPPLCHHRTRRWRRGRIRV